MKIIRGNIRSGKTTELIKKSNKEWKYIICKDKQRVESISKLANDLGIDIPFPITLNELPIRSSYIKSVLVDDIEDILECIIQKPIDYGTTSCKIEKIQMERNPKISRIISDQDGGNNTELITINDRPNALGNGWTNDLTKELDKYLNCNIKEWVTTIHYFPSKNKQVLRFPSGTVGEIITDENKVIIEIVVYEEEFYYCYFKNAKDCLDKYIGAILKYV